MIECKHCSKKKKYGAGYTIDLNKGMVCTNCNGVIYPTHPDHALKINRSEQIRKEVGNRPIHNREPIGFKMPSTGMYPNEYDETYFNMS